MISSKHIGRFVALMVLSAFVIGCGSAGPKDYVPVAERFTLDGDKVEPKNPAELTVCTFNLSEMKTPQLLAEDVRLMPTVDVWILQEVPLPPPGEPLQPTVDKLRALLPAGEWHGVVARMNPADDKKQLGWEGQATLSRFPIGEAQLWRLEASGPKRRRALVAPVESPIGSLQVVNTDHEASFLDPGDGSSKQVTGLISQLRRGGNGPAVVGGDFNSAGNAFRMRTSTKDVDRIINAMASANFVPLPERPDAEAAPTYKFWFAGVQLDHLFSRGLECVEWDSPVTSGSKHRAVWARYKLAPKKE